MKVSLDDRLAALHTLQRTGAERIPESLTRETDALLSRAAERRQRSPGYTVVGLFGATGSGKSSLLNALVGEDVAVTHVRRPTTAEALAVIWDPSGASELLDWLEVRERIVRDAPLDARATQLILLDLPDFDSIEKGNRQIAERLAAQVDALVWVVDPQKYADHVLHAQFITPHARHAEVTLIVLNQTDLLAAAEVPQVVDSLREIVQRDGIARARVMPVSARTGDGIEVLRTAIGDLAASRQARDARLTADIATLAAAMPQPGTPHKLDSRTIARLSTELGDAAGVDVVAAAVAGSYRQRAGRVTGWPLVSWVSGLRADPLKRLGLGAGRAERDPALHRTSMPALSAGARARVSLAVREFADASGEGLAQNWRSAIRTTANDSIASLPDHLDLAIASTPLPSRGSWWWVIFGILQWVAIAAGLIGALWLLAAGVLPMLGLPSFELPRVEGWAVPTLLVVAAVLFGILLGLIGTFLSALTAGSRRRRTRRLLLASVAEIVQSSVVAPITADLARARDFSAAHAVATEGAQPARARR